MLPATPSIQAAKNGERKVATFVLKTIHCPQHYGYTSDYYMYLHVLYMYLHVLYMYLHVHYMYITCTLHVQGELKAGRSHGVNPNPKNLAYTM